MSEIASLPALESFYVTLDLKTLSLGMRPGLTPARGASLAEAAAVCLQDQQHQPVATITVQYRNYKVESDTYRLDWLEADEDTNNCWANEDEATEDGASGIALLLIREITGLTVLRRARRGTGFDYWFGSSEAEGMLFQDSTRMEVSGIRNGKRPLSDRLYKKLRQLQTSHRDLPGFAVVVEFGEPRIEAACP